MTGRRAGEVLLVEDDETLTSILVRYLGAHGIATTVAASAGEAERLLGTGPRLDLLLLDINLPDETGWSILRGPAYAAAGRPPVIVVTATQVPSSRLRDFEVAGYLPKPFSLPNLMEIVKRYCPGETSATVGQAETENNHAR
jgi:DNA-binding response OmpR family regulator